jgi:hypothetical protein
MQADVERLWARLLTDKELRARFFADPTAVAAAHGLSPEECETLRAVSHQDLMTAGRSYAHKAAMKPKPRGWLERFVTCFVGGLRDRRSRAHRLTRVA